MAAADSSNGASANGSSSDQRPFTEIGRMSREMKVSKLLHACISAWRLEYITAHIAHHVCSAKQRIPFPGSALMDTLEASRTRWETYLLSHERAGAMR